MNPERTATILCVSLCGALLFLAVWGGGIFPGALHLTAGLGCAGLLLAGRVRAPAPGAAAAGFVLLTLWVAVSALPFPERAAVWLGDRAAHHEAVVEALDRAAELDLVVRRPAFFSLSRNRAGTLRMLLLLLTAGAGAAMTARLTVPWRRRYLRCLTVLAVLIAVGGYLSQWVFPPGKRIWWLFPVSHGSPVGCFVNRNHFGGYLAMCCPVGMSVFAHDFAAGRRGRAVVWLAALGVMSAAVIASLSRGAAIAFGAALVAGLFVIRVRRPRFWVSAGLALAVAVAAAVLMLRRHPESGERLLTLRRAAASVTGQMRLSTWRDCGRIWRAYPVAGAGMNAFRMVFPAFRSASTRKSYFHAENEYLEIPVEVGAVGTALIILTAAGWWSAVRRGQREPGLPREVMVAALGALWVAAVHAAVDFAVRIPLVAFTAGTLAGLVWPPPAAGDRDERRAGVAGALLPAGGLALVLAVCLAGRAPYRLDNSAALRQADTRTVCRALTWSPTSWQVWYDLGLRAARRGGERNLGFAAHCMTRATELDPQNYRILKQLCRVRFHAGDLAGADEAYRRLKELRAWVRVPELDKLRR